MTSRPTTAPPIPPAAISIRIRGPWLSGMEGAAMSTISIPTDHAPGENFACASSNTARAFSTAFSASQPHAWLREAGLPKCSRSQGIMASTTRGSQGLVAL